MADGNRFFCDITLNEFEEQLGRSHSLGALRSLMDSSLSNLGFGAYAYMRLLIEPSGDVEIQGVTSYPTAWCDRYKSANYLAIDPTLWYCRSQTIPVTWHELSEMGSRQGERSKLFEEAKNYGLCYGITVPLHSGSRWISAMNVVTDLPLKEAIRQITEHRDMVHIMSILFHGTAEACMRTSNVHLTQPQHSSPLIREFQTPKSKRELH